jgi:hypothetical protein
MITTEIKNSLAFYKSAYTLPAWEYDAVLSKRQAMRSSSSSSRASQPHAVPGAHHMKHWPGRQLIIITFRLA